MSGRNGASRRHVSRVQKSKRWRFVERDCVQVERRSSAHLVVVRGAVMSREVANVQSLRITES